MKFIVAGERNLTSSEVRRFLSGEGFSVKDAKSLIKRALIRPGTAVSVANGWQRPTFSVTAER